MNSSNLNIKPKLINQGKNENGNLWFQFVLPNRQYAFIYKNTNGEFYINLTQTTCITVLWTSILGSTFYQTNESAHYKSKYGK